MLATDEDENIRIALASNSKTSREQVLKIDRAGSDWFDNELDSVIARRFEKVVLKVKGHTKNENINNTVIEN